MTPIPSIEFHYAIKDMDKAKATRLMEKDVPLSEFSQALLGDADTWLLW
ncbi:hypothetical protein [Agrobacterium tumefaciens]|nr:hypothetical protein [Agrobacterium tumefaciens]MDS7594634.1 hypothetical protein [Agrobacterium tumefaciens]